MLGACHCGAVAFELVPPLRPVIVCHCSQCRKVSGHVWAATSVPLDRFRLTRDDGLCWFASSAGARRGFCNRCGASLFWQPVDEARISIAAGALDGPTGLQVAAHIHTGDAADYDRPGGSPLAAVPVGDLAASCLCGQVRFNLPGPAGRVTACHCRQCRTLSGHFAASFDADEPTLRYAARDALAEYATAGGGCRGFCTSCGSSLWFRAADGAFAVEAGCIDGPTGGRLADHIFTASKGDYYDLTDGLPQR